MKIKKNIQITLIIFISILCFCNEQINDNKVILNTTAHIGINEAIQEKDVPYQFSNIRCVECDKHGNIYVLDRKDCNIKVFDIEGRFIRKILQGGQGPNEIENPLQIKINKFSGNIFVLHKHGLILKEFDLYGNYISQFTLPEQINGKFDFIDGYRFIYISRKFPYEDIFHNFNIFNFQLNKIEKELIPISRPEITNVYQRFVIKDELLWTCHGDEMFLIGYDLKTGKELQKFMILEEYKKTKIIEKEVYGGKILYAYFFNYAQPLLINEKIYVLVKKQEFKDESRESLLEPIVIKYSLYRIVKSKLVEVADLKEFNKMELGTSFKDKLILYSREPYPHLKVISISE